MGEFGATLMLAGNIPGRTQTMPIAIFPLPRRRYARRASLGDFDYLAVAGHHSAVEQAERAAKACAPAESYASGAGSCGVPAPPRRMNEAASSAALEMQVERRSKISLCK